VTDTINTATKGSLAGYGWVFDEMLASGNQYGMDLTPLLTAVLMKGAKTRGCLIGISQADTSSAHGLKGIDAAWRGERIDVLAVDATDDMGDRSPSGRYIVTQAGEAEEWAIPEWMLTELNRYGVPCPVVWMLSRFPELAGTVQNRFSNGSGAVQGLNPGSESVQGLNPGSAAVQGLNRTQDGTFIASGSPSVQVLNHPEPVQNRPEPAISGLNLNLNRDELIQRIDDLRASGLNQAQIIQALWGVKKGGSQTYLDALAQYREIKAIA
jgi:hypothetical protein